MRKVDQLIESIFLEAKESIIKDLANTIIDCSSDFWIELKTKHGAKAAATAVMCLFQEAINDGEIRAAKFTDSDGDNFDTAPIGITVIDECCLHLDGTGGISISVVCNDQ